MIALLLLWAADEPDRAWLRHYVTGWVAVEEDRLLAGDPAEVRRFARAFRRVAGAEAEARRWLPRLDCEEYADRLEAEKVLRRLGPGALLALSWAVKESPALEVRHRARLLLAAWSADERDRWGDAARRKAVLEALHLLPGGPAALRELAAVAGTTLGGEAQRTLEEGP